MSNRRRDRAAEGLEEIVARGRRNRRSDRRVVEVPAEVKLDPQELEARTQDVSNGGVLLVAEGHLKVRVSFEVDGETVEREARLIRCQQLAAGQIAYALQFYDSLDGPGAALPGNS
ncbi:MAG: PilZ domain-containing protein [Planctomycetota bacterium]